MCRPSDEARLLVEVEAERVAVGVEHHADIVVGLVRRGYSAESHRILDSSIDVSHADIEMELHLLATRPVRPHRPLIVLLQLEGEVTGRTDSAGVVDQHRDPARLFPRNLTPEQIPIEPRERLGVRTTQDNAQPTSETANTSHGLAP